MKRNIEKPKTNIYPQKRKKRETKQTNIEQAKRQSNSLTSNTNQTVCTHLIIGNDAIVQYTKFHLVS